MKNTYRLKNYNAQNTPPNANLIGNILLAIGAASATILLLPTTLPIILPVFVVKICSWGVIFGVLGKFFSKFWGKDYSQ